MQQIWVMYENLQGGHFNIQMLSKLKTRQENILHMANITLVTSHF